MSQKKIVIIGAGFGGLASATLLAKQGFDVTVVEKNSQAGGRAMMYHEKGFHFDMGPSWYLMPDVFERFFTSVGVDVNKALDLERLDPAYRIFFDKNDTIDISSDLEKNKELFESIEPGAAKAFQEYLDKSKYLYDMSIKHFLYREFKSVFSFFQPRLVLEAHKFKLFESLQKYVARFFDDDKLQKILQYSIVFLGGTPKNTPALYALMAHVDFNLGVWYPKGGMNAVAKAITKIAQDAGVKFKFSSPVSNIEIQDGQKNKGHAKAVVTDKETIAADIVLVNTDYHHAETKLLPTQYQTYDQEYWESRKIAPSAFVIYLGLNKKIKELKHHNLFLYHDWVQHFDQIFDKPAWPENPSYYVCAPSVTDRSVAPVGCENLFVLVPVAAGLEDSDQLRREYADKIIDHLSSLVGEDLDDYIVVKRVFTHRDFSSVYNAYKGTALGLSHTLFQTANFRPQLKSKKVDNLYYVGQFTQPGIGVPMVLISADVVTKKILKEQK